MTMQTFEQFVKETKINMTDLQAMQQAIEDYSKLLEKTVDLSTLDAQAFAEHFNYDFNKLNSFIKKDNEFKTVAFEALQIANEREEALLTEIDDIENDIREKQSRVKKLRASLYATKSRVETPRQSTVETPSANVNRQAIASVDNDYDDCAKSAKSRRNFLIKAFTLAKSRSEKVNFSTLYNLSKTRAKLDFDKFNSNQINAAKTVCKQDLGIKWDDVLNIDMIYEDLIYDAMRYACVINFFYSRIRAHIKNFFFRTYMTRIKLTRPQIPLNFFVFFK